MDRFLSCFLKLVIFLIVMAFSLSLCWLICSSHVRSFFLIFWREKVLAELALLLAEDDPMGEKDPSGFSRTWYRLTLSPSLNNKTVTCKPNICLLIIALFRIKKNIYILVHFWEACLRSSLCFPPSAVQFEIDQLTDRCRFASLLVGCLLGRLASSKPTSTSHRLESHTLTDSSHREVLSLQKEFLSYKRFRGKRFYD